MCSMGYSSFPPTVAPAQLRYTLGSNYQGRGVMAKNWIKGATANKGGLHRSLGVPADKPIPRAKIKAAAAGTGKTAKQARLALTLAKMRKK